MSLDIYNEELQKWAKDNMGSVSFVCPSCGLITDDRIPLYNIPTGGMITKVCYECVKLIS